MSLILSRASSQMGVEGAYHGFAFGPCTCAIPGVAFRQHRIEPGGQDGQPAAEPGLGSPECRYLERDARVAPPASQSDLTRNRSRARRALCTVAGAHAPGSGPPEYSGRLEG